MKLFDPKAYHLHHKRAKKTFHTHNFLFEHVGDELLSRLQDLKKSFTNPLSLSPCPLSYGAHHETLEETLPHSEGEFDLILSCLQTHWINDLKGHLKSIHSTLQPEGLFLGALWGGQTLFELRQCLLEAESQLTDGAFPRIAPFLHPADAPTLLSQAGFSMPVVDTEKISVSYPSLVALMKDLRGMGETNKLYDRQKSFTSRKLFKKAEDIYRTTFGHHDLRIPATFEVIYLTGWKIHTSTNGGGMK